MDRVEIPNRVADLPVALPDLMLAAPLASRILLGASGPGLALQVAALGAYAGSSLNDWVRRRDARKIGFLDTYAADVDHLRPTPIDARRREIDRLTEQVGASYQPMRIPRRELAVAVNEHLTCYIASITGQRVETSDSVRSFMLAKLVFPFALGGCDFISGDVAIFQHTGVFEPHVIAHEFSHRKGYFKELEAQALAYLSLVSSGDPVLEQSAHCERLHRQMRVVARHESADEEGAEERYHELVDRSRLPAELKWAFHSMLPRLSPPERAVATVVRKLYDERMRLTGQNGLTDYDEGFTDFLYTKESAVLATT